MPPINDTNQIPYDDVTEPSDATGSEQSSARRALPRLLGVVLLALLGLYVARVAGLVVTLQRAALAEAGLATEVDALRTEVAGLETAAADAQSDAYVERWAREERTLSRPGDQTIVVVETSADPAQPVEQEDGLLRRLRRLFIGDEPADPAPIEGESPAP